MRELTKKECGEHDPEFVQDIFDIIGHLAFTLDAAKFLDAYFSEESTGRDAITYDVTADKIIEAHRKHNNNGANIHDTKIVELLRLYLDTSERGTKKTQQWIAETESTLASIAENYTKNLISGTDFINQVAAKKRAIWGDGQKILWATGESLMIASPYGVGKTTLAGLISKATLLGGSVLGYPINQDAINTDGDELKLLYLALDRPNKSQHPSCANSPPPN
jgi:hypothetical protein